MALQREVGIRHEAAAVLADLAHLAQLDGDLETASNLYAEVVAEYRECEDRPEVVNGLVNSGLVALRMDDISKATEMLTEAVALAREVNSARQILVTIEAIAWLIGATGQPLESVRLLSAAQANYKTHSFSRPIIARAQYERNLQSVRTQIDQSTWQKWWAKGETMSLEEALRCASECLDVNRRKALGE